MSRNRSAPPRSLAAWCVVSLCAVVGGCGPAASEPAAAPAVRVSVALPIQRAVTDYEEFTGRSEAVQTVELRARVSGYLEDVQDVTAEQLQQLRKLGLKLPWKEGEAIDKGRRLFFQEGDEVVEGQLLFLIDPRPYQAEYDKSVAQVALREANLALQNSELKRNKPLMEKGAVSPADFDKTVAAAQEAAASVTAAKAALESLALNLEFTRVPSPLDGRVSRAEVTPGNLVKADSTLLTTVVSLDPMYVYFDVEEQTILRIQAGVRQGKIESREAGKVAVHMGLGTDKGYPHRGAIDFADNRVDPSTGTIRVRGVFPNPKPDVGQRTLLPGLFARVQVPVGAPRKATLVAEQALGTQQGRKYLLVVNDKQQVDQRMVTLGRLEGGLRVIEEGLTPTERVIVVGIQRAQPGADVEVEATVTMDSLVPPAEADAASGGPESAAGKSAAGGAAKDTKSKPADKDAGREL
jgi:multidrug efflux system membrane fusion protein